MAPTEENTTKNNENIDEAVNLKFAVGKLSSGKIGLVMDTQSNLDLTQNKAIDNDLRDQKRKGEADENFSADGVTKKAVNFYLTQNAATDDDLLYEKLERSGVAEPGNSVKNDSKTFYRLTRNAPIDEDSGFDEEFSGGGRKGENGQKVVKFHPIKGLGGDSENAKLSSREPKKSDRKRAGRHSCAPNFRSTNFSREGILATENETTPAVGKIDNGALGRRIEANINNKERSRRINTAFGPKIGVFDTQPLQEEPIELQPTLANCNLDSSRVHLVKQGAEYAPGGTKKTNSKGPNGPKFVKSYSSGGFYRKPGSFRARDLHIGKDALDDKALTLDDDSTLVGANFRRRKSSDGIREKLWKMLSSTGLKNGAEQKKTADIKSAGTIQEKSGGHSHAFPTAPALITIGPSPASSVGSAGSCSRNGQQMTSQVVPKAVFTLNSAPGGSSSVWYDNDKGNDENDLPLGSTAENENENESWKSSSGDATDSSEDARGKVLRKIQATKDRLKTENSARENDVDEYIKLTQGLPISSVNPQLMRIRQVFEKKNKKHAQLAEQLQKKLEMYNQRLADLDSGKKGGKDTMLTNVGQGLKDMGANLKGTITDYTGSVIAVPKDLASRLKHKAFGSADNLHSVSSKTDHSMIGSPGRSHLGVIRPPEGPRSVHGLLGGHVDDMGRLIYNTFEDRTRALSADQASLHSAGSRDGATSAPLNDHEPLNASSMIHNFYDIGSVSQVRLDPILAEIRVITEKQDRVQSALEELRGQMQQEYTYFNNVLHEEKYRYQRLEDQMNDTVELHQAEVLNLKQEIQSLGARLQYQHDERFRDIHDLVENSQNRIAKIELQFQSQENVVSPEGLNAFALRGMNILILILQFLLILASMMYQVVQPFVKSRTRTTMTLITLLLLFVVWKTGFILEITRKLTNSKLLRNGSLGGSETLSGNREL